MDPTLARVCDLLHQASATAVLTGAGISAESGIPDLSRSRRHLAHLPRGRPGHTVAKNPKLVWEGYNFRRDVIAGVEPNAGHQVPAEIEQRNEGFCLITQNVDGLHDRAGSRNLLKLHGDIWTLRCTVCARERGGTATPLPQLPPHCACGGMERPGVVWFGEGLPKQIWINAQRAAQNAQMLLVIGTSAVVYPAAGLAALAKRSGAVVVEINIAETPVSAQADYSLRGPAAEILPQLVQRRSDT